MTHASLSMDRHAEDTAARQAPLSVRSHDGNLIKSRARRLKRLLLRNGRSLDDADDLVQEAFLRLHLHSTAEVLVQEEVFLRRTVINLSIDLHRRSHRELYVDARPEDLALVDLRPRPDEDLALWERLMRVERALDLLGERTREVFLMHRIEGYSCAQIAAHFHISVSAVEKHIARAMFELINALEN